MTFHRLNTPGYFGGLPAGYDYINNPAANGDPGVPAYADGKKASGPNQGTYLNGFGEDATSSELNRGGNALATNTDALDDILRADVAFTARTADVTAGSPVASIVISGQVFVGASGVTNNQATRDLLISVLDSNDDELLVGSTKIVASLIGDGTGVNVVGTQASGFYNTPTVTFNTAIPVGVTYRVYYGYRGNLATMPLDAFTNIRIRGAQEVTASVELVLRNLHTVVGSPNWDDPWVATVNSLARTGLDGRYRLSTVDPGTGLAVNTPGNGGTILRDGPAPATGFPSMSLSTGGSVGGPYYPDPLLAGWRMKRASPVVTVGYNLDTGGDVGLLQESTYHSTGDSAEVAYAHVTNALVLDVIPRSITASTIGSHSGVVRSRINSAVVATVNAAAGTDSTSLRTVTLGTGDYIRNGSGNIGVRTIDLLEITDNVTGRVIGTYRLDTVLSNNSFTLKTVTGVLPTIGLPSVASAVRVRWLQRSVSIGGQNAGALGTDPAGIPSLLVAMPGLLTDAPDDNAYTAPPTFLSAMYQRTLGATGDGLFYALGWGGFDNAGAYKLNGSLLGDGGITTLGGRQQLNMLNRRNSVNVITDNTTSTLALTIDPVTQGSSVNLYVTGGPSSMDVTFLVDTTKGYTERNGDELSVLIVLGVGFSLSFTVAWPSNFIFSAGDAAPPSVNLTSSAIIVQYLFRYQVINSVGGWFAERKDY